MAATIGDMHSVLVQGRAESLFKQKAGKTEFCRAFGNNRQAREECFRIGLA